VSTAERFKKWAAVAAVAVAVVSCGGNSTMNTAEDSRESAPQTAQTEQEVAPLWTGDGGKGIRLAVLEPSGEGLSEDDQWMLSLVQGSITGDFNKFSGMTIIDRQNLEKVIAEQIEATSGKYSDDDQIRIGNLTNASHILTGSISRTPNALMVEFSVTELESNERKASYSPKPVSIRALENLSAVKEASADLLTQLGVNLTSAGLAQLKQVESNTKIQAETMLARGITAQKGGTEVAALSYFFQAAALDPSLLEAAKRSQTLSVNISSGNIGDRTRNDIQWRKDWIARLTEMETSFSRMIDAADPPYRLYYSTNIKQGEIDYKRETTSFSFPINLHADKLWFSSIEEAVKVVYNGLNATGKKNDWELAGWPLRGVSGNNPFDREGYSIAVEFELVNQQGKVIGKQTENIRTSYRFSPKAEYSENTFETVTFNAVNANDISDVLTIRVASINKTDPEYARIQITALSDKMWQIYSNFSKQFVIKNGVGGGVLDLPRSFKKMDGVVCGFDESILHFRTWFIYGSKLFLYTEIWGEPVNGISNRAFEYGNSADGREIYHFPKRGMPKLGGVTIIGDRVAVIGAGAFYGHELSNVTIPGSVTFIGRYAFASDPRLFGGLTGPDTITIGSNVTLGENAFARGFENYYQNSGRKAGTYTYNKESKTWSYSPIKQ